MYGCSILRTFRLSEHPSPHISSDNRRSTVTLSSLYNKSRLLLRIGGLSACMGNVVHNNYTTGTFAFRQSTQACGISITYIWLRRHGVSLALAVVITNGPQDTTVCVNQYANIQCGFTGADPNLVVPNWTIIKRDRNGTVVSNDTVNGTEINRFNNGLKWKPDLANPNNSLLRVGPVGSTDNQSSYQCSFVQSNDTTYSSVAMLTVLGEFSV